MLRHGLSRPHQHILTSLSPSDALHTLRLTTIHAACLVVRCGCATTISSWSSFLLIVHTEHIEELLAVLEPA